MTVEYRNLPLRHRLKTRARNRHKRRFWDRHDRRTYQCPSCGCDYDGAGREWEVHHKDGDALNGHIFNLVALCHSCHRRTHSAIATMLEVEEWKEEFRSLGEPDEKNIAVSDLSVTGQTTIEDYVALTDGGERQ